MNTQSAISTKKEFGGILRQLRREAHITRWEAATACGIHGETIANWERGKCVPSSANLVRVLRFYGTDERTIDRIYKQTDYYVTGEEE